MWYDSSHAQYHGHVPSPLIHACQHVPLTGSTWCIIPVSHHSQPKLALQLDLQNSLSHLPSLDVNSLSHFQPHADRLSLPKPPVGSLSHPKPYVDSLSHALNKLQGNSLWPKTTKAFASPFPKSYCIVTCTTCHAVSGLRAPCRICSGPNSR